MYALLNDVEILPVHNKMMSASMKIVVIYLTDTLNCTASYLSGADRII
jgi:hypothetical protein